LATNDPSLAPDALVRLLRAGTHCELELMHGAARSPSLQVARRLGVPVRCFVPWGATRRPLAVSPGARDPREAGWAREAPPRALRLLSRA
jgi:proline dehydrogenase